MVGVTAQVGHRPADVVMAIAALGILLLLEACSSATPSARLETRTTTTTNAISAVEMALLAAWNAAENAFYEAEADPNGLTSPLYRRP